MKIYDNFLSSEEFKEITDFVYGDDILWEETIKVPGDDSEDNFQYVHLAYCNMTPISPFYSISWSVLSRVKPIAIHRIKINMEPKHPERYFSRFHYDWNSSRGTHENPIGCAIMKTGILYLDNTNGYTEFETGEIVESVENRFIEFPSNISHRGVSQTDADWRSVINFNYFVGDPESRELDK
tara:strand:+ start:288 stop:833 length:546 start_codon:yes stop_codon:yes gene_type:complete